MKSMENMESQILLCRQQGVRQQGTRQQGIRLQSCRLRLWIVCLLLAAGIAGCGKSRTEAEASSKPPDSQENWMGGLDEAQRLEDLESLCDGLRENYPYLTLAWRQTGADLDALEEQYRQKVKECASDDAFYKVLHEFVNEFGFTGHLDIWGLRYESQLAGYKSAAADPALAAHLAPYVEALENPVTQKTYASMKKYYQDKESKVQESTQTDAGNAAGEEMAEEAVEESAEETWPAENVETRILEPGKTAYVFISMFDREKMETDREILQPFYEQIREYDNLIIDITQNPGGSMAYFNELVVAPLADRTLTVPTYQLFKDGDVNRRFLGVEEGIASGQYRPVSELPSLPELNREDASECTLFLREDYTVEPAGEGFAGKIWLLVSGANYSSSEYAAMFSKATGFATLVGETTSGDGIGTDPVYLILPNSGMVVQYSPMYGVSADGTGSEEYGTTPDIVSPPGESALDTCVRRIDLLQQER